ncbi:hypothetical protein GCM10007424_26750 [Flavobacterium suaedae]|uniref:DUF1232 domain-containing protein n=1 Tax=Flavobacterium suaedae TaxID=1767027 RepID=A0ABQ1K553_9FLAO|nr:YkvA family protein [Flavobacterium suaedae]GGB85358.1 hypothetical protein GCM10007424_26750 [Flavobacterium suaedae]
MKEFTEEQAKEELNRKQQKFSPKDFAKLIAKGDVLKNKFKTRKKLSKFVKDFKVLFAMVKDYYKGNYKKVPWYIISSIGATLLYVLLPTDAVPDFIPFVGYIDDATIFSLCLKIANTEVKNYLKWKEENTQDNQNPIPN